MTEKKKFYLTTPIYYANSRPHVGSAYTTIVCDVIGRYKRMCGYDVAYLTGTDEHGVNIERAAEGQGISPQQLVDKNQQIFRDLWRLLGIQYTDFVRTTSSEHARAVQNLVRRTRKRSPDAIYKKKYEGRYCIYDNFYVSDTPEPANCQICGRAAELISEQNYFFRLSAFQDKLLALYRERPDWVQPAFRLNEMQSFVEAGLKDVSISRKTIKWGIPWPDDPEHVFYVWYDALTSYMSGIGYGEGEDGEASAKYNRFWPADLHMIGKEILRFHAVYWPAFLMAAGLPLPAKIFAHGWLLFEEKKMSKSTGNVAYPEPIVRVLGNDALRYYLLRETVFGQDGNFSRDALVTRYNADLANGLGNLASRTLAMIGQYFDGHIPEMPGELDDASIQIERRSSYAVHEALRAYEVFDFSGALAVIWDLISLIDKYLVERQPWVIAKDPSRRPELGTVLFVAYDAVRIAACLAHPVLPESTVKIWAQLGQTGDLSVQKFQLLAEGRMSQPSRIGTPAPVFPRADKKEVLEKIEAMENQIKNPESPEPARKVNETDSAIEPAPDKIASAAAAATVRSSSTIPGIITIDDFAKVELRVGQVKQAERIQGADKLLKLQVDLGNETRQILAGIATAYAPEELVGRKVVVVANLAPRKMRGLESNGMLLAGSAEGGNPVLCTFGEEIAPGAKVR